MYGILNQVYKFRYKLNLQFGTKNKQLKNTIKKGHENIQIYLQVGILEQKKNEFEQKINQLLKSRIIDIIFHNKSQSIINKNIVSVHMSMPSPFANQSLSNFYSHTIKMYIDDQISLKTNQITAYYEEQMRSINQIFYNQLNHQRIQHQNEKAQIKMFYQQNFISCLQNMRIRFEQRQSEIAKKLNCVFKNQKYILKEMSKIQTKIQKIGKVVHYISMFLYEKYGQEIFDFNEDTNSYPEEAQQKNYMTEDMKIDRNGFKVNKEYEERRQQSIIWETKEENNYHECDTEREEISKKEKNGLKKMKQEPFKGLKNSQDYLDFIVKYSQTFDQQADIKFKISSFGGARSDPQQIWRFSNSIISSIDPNNHSQMQTLSHKIWHYVVNVSIKGSNIIDGFQTIPPKQRNCQVQKNQIMTYIIIINTLRAIGNEQIWLGILGKTLSMLSFLYDRKKPLNKRSEGQQEYKDENQQQQLILEKLDLMKINYISKEGDISLKYLSRIDFMTYFLIGLTTIDPLLFFQQVRTKPDQQFEFQKKLREKQWSYTEFWCLIHKVFINPFRGYFKIPFWNNVVSLMYLQSLQNKKDKSKFGNFQILKHKIFDLIKSLTSTIMEERENKLIMEINIQEQNYDFDGECFINAISSLGKKVISKQKSENLSFNKFLWANSIVYYFKKQMI